MARVVLRSIKTNYTIAMTGLLLLILSLCSQCESRLHSPIIQDLTLVIEGQKPSQPFRHFWKSTGFCPPQPHQAAADFDLSPDMEQNLAYIGAVPHSGIEQVRIHWLLDLVTVTRFSSGEPVYNFTNLDTLMSRLRLNGLKPGFEIMGSPSGIFTDMENKTQVYWFRDLVKQTAQRYISMFGLDYVKTWNFETWNEPDCHDFDELLPKMTTQGFFNYYDACSEGLKAASPELIFGGPGNGCSNVVRKRSSTDYGLALLGHVSNGTNYFTGEKGVRMDYISLHKKGDEHSLQVLEDDVEAMNLIRNQFPQLMKVPYFNDEGDPLAGWSKPKAWRALATYASMAVKILAQHQNMLIGPGKSPLTYSLLSNDNGFLSYYPHQFTQRTLVARFQMNFTSVNNKNSSSGDSNNSLIGIEGNRKGSSSRNYVTFVRKPIYAAMVLLSKLGDRVVPSQVVDSKTKQPLPLDEFAGAMSTMYLANEGGFKSYQWTTIFYTSEDTTYSHHDGLLNINWTINVSNATDLMMAGYIVSDGYTNPYDVWLMCGGVSFPSLEEFLLLRKNEGPFRFGLEAVSSNNEGVVSIPFRFAYSGPQVLLLHLCQKPILPPEGVTNLFIINITAGQRLIRWSEANIQIKCIKTYEVEFAVAGSENYQRINSDDVIVNAFVFATDSESKVVGRYRVRAVDYWGRAGPYSPTLTHT